MSGVIHPSKSVDRLTPSRIMAITIIGIFLAEVVAMLVIYRLEPMPFAWQTVVDALVMTVLIYPLLYFLSFKPLLTHIAEREIVEVQLHQVQAGLQQQVQQFRLQSAALEAAANGIIIADREGNIRWVNPAFTQMTGYTQEEVLGQNPRLLKSEKHEPEFYRRMWETILAGEVWRGEMINLRKDGSLYTEEQTITPLIDENGEIANFIAIKQDITERIVAERAVHQNEALFRKVLENLPVGVWIIDQSGKVIKTNTAGEQIWAGVWNVGIERYGEYKGWWLNGGELIRPEEWAAARAITLGETSINEEVEIECFDGTHRIVFNSAIPIRDELGAIQGAIVVEQDITERKRAEEVLNQERQQLSGILDTMQDGVCIVNRDFSIEYINPVIERDFGSVAGRKCHAYFHRLSLPCEWCKNEEVFAGKSINWEWRSEKTKRTYDLFDTPLVNADGTISKLEIFHDITDRKWAEVQLERSIEELRSLSEAEGAMRELAEGLAQSVIALASSLKLEDVLSVLLDQIRRSVPFRGANVALIEGETLHVACFRGYEDLPIGATLMGRSFAIDEFLLFRQVYDTFQPLLVPDTQQEPLWSLSPGQEWVRSCLAAPLIRDGHIFGIIYLTSAEPGFFNPETVERVMAYIASAALAIYNAQLYKAEQTARQVAETLSQAAQAMTQILDLDRVIHTLLEHIDTIIHPDLSGVAFMQGENRLAVRAVRGGERWINTDEILSIIVDLNSSSLLQELLTTHKSILVSDTTAFAGWQALPSLAPFRCVLLVPLIAGDKVIGLVGLVKADMGYFTQEHIKWVEALAGQAAVSIQNAWLFEQVRDNSERLQFLARRLVEVQENERRFVAQELHDEVGQALTSVMLGLRIIEKEAGDPARTSAEAEEMSRVLDNAMENIHRLAMDLRPAALDKLGLEAALRQHIRTVRKRFGLEIQFDMTGVSERMTPRMEIALYRILQEALNNVARHAKATRADVLIQTRGDNLILIVEDNGVGFDPQTSAQVDRLGIFGMCERAEMLGGKLTVESSPGKGTTVFVEVPYEHANSHRG